MDYALLSALSGLPLRQDLAVTGSVNQHGEVQAVGGVQFKMEGYYDLCAARGIALVLDETYLDFRDTDERPHDLFDRADWGDTLIQLYSFSKVFALTGYRVGAITARAQALIEIEKIMDCVAICAPHIGQRAALFGLNHLHDWKREKAEMMLNVLEPRKRVLEYAVERFVERALDRI